MIIRHWRSLFVFFIWAILLGTPANMAAQNYSYGINSDFQRPEQGTKISELGAGFARFTLYWNEFEPTKGDYQWYIMNNNVTEASNRNIQLFVTLGERSPGWAAPCQACAPYNWQDWYDFVYTVALNYPSVQYWPRWTPENRPLIDTSKPATTGVATETADY